jgi:hypothetical protein
MQTCSWLILYVFIFKPLDYDPLNPKYVVEKHDRNKIHNDNLIRLILPNFICIVNCCRNIEGQTLYHS